MSEENLWVWLRDEVLPLGQYSRIESPDTAAGFPDVDGLIQVLGKPFAFKFELKFSHSPHAEIPLTDDNGVRKSQRKWIRDATRYTPYIWVVIEIGEVVLFIPGLFVDEINGATEDFLTRRADLLLPRHDANYSAKQLQQFFEKEMEVPEP